MPGPGTSARSVSGWLLPTRVILAAQAGCQHQAQSSLCQHHSVCAGNPPRRATDLCHMAQPHCLVRAEQGWDRLHPKTRHHSLPKAASPT